MTPRHTTRWQAIRHQQRGTSLLVAMVALVAMMTAGIALMRSIDSANLAASNFQMQQNAEQNIDMAINEALLAYMQSSPDASLNMLNRNVDNSAVDYWSSEQAAGAEGIPDALLALSAPAWGTTGPQPTGWPGEQIDEQSGQLRRYFVERMCRNGFTGPASANSCAMYTVMYDSTAGAHAGLDDSDLLPYVRITVRVDGPKGAVSYGRMFMKGE